MEYATRNSITDIRSVVWLDLLSGILNVSLGHGSPVVRRALKEIDVTGLINTYDRPSQNSFRLKEMLGTYDNRFDWHLLNTGAEAIERAIQVVSSLKCRPVKIAILQGSFHGKSISMSYGRYREVPWGNPIGLVEVEPDKDSSLIPDFDVLIYEPIAGWDGTPVDETRLRMLCDEREAFLIADEMITGFLRCGRRFLNRTADMVVSGKGLAQGAPLSVLGIKQDLMPLFHLNIGWNTTTGGNNLSATIGLHVLRHLIQSELELLGDIQRIENALSDMGFSANGALGFMRLEEGSSGALRVRFENRHVIASWHEDCLRVGPSFITTDGELALLEKLIEERT